MLNRARRHEDVSGEGDGDKLHVFRNSAVLKGPWGRVWDVVVKRKILTSFNPTAT